MLTVRQISGSLYDSLSQLAKKNRRSLQQQAILLLERACWLQPDMNFTDRAQLIRERPKGRILGDTTEDIHQERNVINS
ncbi:MAG: hypothetical protein I8H75_04665 [Myxococcaceae bacterium]|nr:hypothetical protein [Myxococcaceae bacterium]